MSCKAEFKETEVGLIPKGWSVVEVSDFVDIKHGYAFKGKFFTDEENENVILTPGNFHIGGGFKDDKFKFTTEDYPLDYILKKGDIVVTMTDLSKKGDTLGYAAKIPGSNKKKYLHNQRLGLLQFKSNAINRDFLHWALRTKRYNWFVVGSATGSTVKHTSPSRIKLYKFACPTDLKEQQAIAYTLSSLDDKIELNRRMNATLEQIAQTIFKQWFIDFEFPDERGQPYKSSGGEMVESELGEIPRGWEVKSIDEIADFLNGLALQKYPPEGDDYLPVIKIRELKQGITDSTDKASPNIDEKYIIDDGDVLFSWSGSLECCLWSHGKGALNQHLFKVTSEHYPKWFYYFWIMQHLPAYRRIAKDKTTTMGHIKRRHLSESLVLVPPMETIDKMDVMMNPLFEKTLLNNLNSLLLSLIRDLLLPKLMSGRIRLS
jgi:type I restriction enzyme S subunit